MAKLCLDLNYGDRVQIGDTILTLERKFGAVSRIAIEAGLETKIQRLPAAPPRLGPKGIVKAG